MVLLLIYLLTRYHFELKASDPFDTSDIRQILINPIDSKIVKLICHNIQGISKLKMGRVLTSVKYASVFLWT